MPVIASKLIERFKSLSPEEQEELDRQATERLQSLLKSNFQVSLQPSFLSALQYIQEAVKTSFNDLFKGWLTELKQISPHISGRYYTPAYLPPPFYPEKSRPQVINMHTVYLSVSNIPVHFLFILVKRTR